MTNLEISKSVQEISNLGDQHRKIKSFLKEFGSLITDNTYNELVEIHNKIIEEKKQKISEYKPRDNIYLVENTNCK